MVLNRYPDPAAPAADDAATITALAEFAIAFMRDAQMSDAAILATFAENAANDEADHAFAETAAPAAVRAEIRRLIGAARG